MLINNIPRVFTYKPATHKPEIELADPDITLSPDEVRVFFATTMPACAALITATVEAPQFKGDKIIYNFRNSFGEKG